MSVKIGINIIINVALLMLDHSLKAIGRVFAQMFLIFLSPEMMMGANVCYCLRPVNRFMTREARIHAP